MKPLVIFGASTRAAAFSAIRAGLDPICGDMFADADLRAFATVLDVPQYPHALTQAIQHLSPLPWLYTGALENSPTEIARLCERNPLLGNGSASLQRCRDPWVCHEILRRAGLPTLELRSSESPPPRDGRWLMKPLRSAAGRAIALWDTDTISLPEPHYFQQIATGTSIAAAFLATSGAVELLGISQQLIGCSELHAPAYGYCGSIFPWPECPPSIEEEICLIGSAIGRECGLRGLFGIDLISDGESGWLTEVNPRYTASMELIEHQRQVSLLDLHSRACADDTQVLATSTPAILPGSYCGKVILYADRTARSPDLSDRIPKSITLADLPELADIPAADTEIWPGQPVFTCLKSGNDPAMLYAELVEQAQKLWRDFI